MKDHVISPDLSGVAETLLLPLYIRFGDFLFMRKMLLGIKQRAETAYRSQVMA